MVGRLIDTAWVLTDYRSLLPLLLSKVWLGDDSGVNRSTTLVAMKAFTSISNLLSSEDRTSVAFPFYLLFLPLAFVLPFLFVPLVILVDDFSLSFNSLCLLRVL